MRNAQNRCIAGALPMVVWSHSLGRSKRYIVTGCLPNGQLTLKTVSGFGGVQKSMDEASCGRKLLLASFSHFTTHPFVGRGRPLMSLCRYIEHGLHAKTWCLSNMSLEHAIRLWRFGCVFAAQNSSLAGLTLQ